MPYNPRSLSNHRNNETFTFLCGIAGGRWRRCQWPASFFTNGTNGAILFAANTRCVPMLHLRCDRDDPAPLASWFSWSTGVCGALNGDLRLFRALGGCGRPHIVSAVHAASFVAGHAVCRPRGGRYIHRANEVFAPKHSYKRGGTLGQLITARLF